MASFDLLQLQKNLRDLGILISFSGQFSQGIIEELSEAIKKHLEKENMAKGDIFNVITVFIEQAQNIRNYSSRCEQATSSENYCRISSSGIVTIGKDRDGYFIFSGNLVMHHDMKELSDYLGHLSCLEKEELKRLYKGNLKKERTPDQISAGLGLIDLFRKATAPVTYSFSEYDHDLKFYSIKVTV